MNAFLFAMTFIILTSTNSCSLYPALLQSVLRVAMRFADLSLFLLKTLCPGKRSDLSGHGLTLSLSSHWPPVQPSGIHPFQV